MAAPGQQAPEQGSNDLLWLLALVIAIPLALWFFARAPMLKGILSFKLLEIKLYSLFTDHFLPIEAEIRAYIDMGALDKVPFAQFSHWMSVIGFPISIPTLGLSLLAAGYLYFTHPALKFLNSFDMQRLLQTEKGNWPQITPVADLDLLNADLNEGPWSMAMSPMVFAKKYKLIEELPPKPVTSFLQPSFIEVTVIAKKAEAIFAKQVGPLWKGAQNLPPHARALFAVFALRANGERPQAVKFLEQFASSAGGGKPNFSGIDEAIQKQIHTPLIQEVISRHAYQYTVMAAMLELARGDGVLSSSDFLWLKPIDRPLWFMLNNTGRQVAFTEVAGAFAHFRAEKLLKRKLTQPLVNEAVTALDLALKDIIYTRDAPKEEGMES